MKKKILVIEDDKILQNLLKLNLEREGYKVFCASDGKEGLKKIWKIMPNLIILDLIMPEKSGEQVLEEMNKFTIIGIDNHPVIVLTNKDDIETVNKCFSNLNVLEYFIKSEYSLDSLINKVNKILNKK